MSDTAKGPDPVATADRVMFAKLVQRLLEKDLISVSDVRGAMDDALHELSSYGPEVFEQGRRSIRHALVSMRIESDD